MTIKVGKIYKQKNGEIFVISHVDESCYHILYNDGYTASYYIYESSCFCFDNLIAEYPTWQEAVNSKEFKND